MTLNLNTQRIINLLQEGIGMAFLIMFVLAVVLLFVVIITADKVYGLIDSLRV